jgi:hypothetical protein
MMSHSSAGAPRISRLAQQHMLCHDFFVNACTQHISLPRQTAHPQAGMMEKASRNVSTGS